MPSMMAWRVHEFGPPSVMRFERVSRPAPGGTGAELATYLVEKGKPRVEMASDL